MRGRRGRSGNSARADVLAAGHPVLNGATMVAVVRGRLLVLSQTGMLNGSVPDDPVLVEVPIRH